MNKKKIGITFVALVCLAAVVLTIFYMISNGKTSGSRELLSSHRFTQWEQPGENRAGLRTP